MIAARGASGSGATSPREMERLDALRRLGVLDQKPEPVLERLVELVAKLLDVPIVLISLVDQSRQFFFARTGLAVAETSREAAFCDFTIRDDEVLIVADALQDERFRENPLVTGEPKIRFYAGAPLLVGEGLRIGSVCVIDRQPRVLDPTQIALLEEFAAFVVEHMESRLRFLEADATRGYLQSILDASPSSIISVDRQGRVVQWNAAAERLSGRPAHEAIGSLPPSLPPEEVPAFLELVRRVFEGELFSDVPSQRIARGNERHTVSVSAAPVRKSDGSIVAAVLLARNVTDAKRREEIDRRLFEILELTANGAPLQRIFDMAIECLEFGLSAGVGSIMLQEGATLRNAAAGRSMSEFMRRVTDQVPVGPNEGSCGTAAFSGKPVFVADVTTDPRWAKQQEVARRGGFAACWSVPIPSIKSGVLGTFAAYLPTTGGPSETQARFMAEMAHLVSIAVESDRARQRLELAALRDPLTDLPNRTAFDDRLRLSLQKARDGDTKVAIGVVDLDGFKEVNDRFGHAVGDLLLREVASRLQHAGRAGDMVARVGGDEFLICLGGLTDRSALEKAMGRFAATLDTVYRPGGREVDVSASIGVALYPDDATEPSELYRLADRAMYAAKSAKGGIRFHGASASGKGRDARSLVFELAAAVEREQLVLAYQPIVSLADRCIVGVEALVRWNHPVRGLLGSGEYRELAEETGLCIPIGAWAIAESARAARHFADAGIGCAVYVDVSARHFEEPGFAASVAEAIAAAAAPPGTLYLEVSENLIMRSPLTTTTTLHRLAEAGARVLIDDYGTGYSSLSYLRGVPLAGVKIHPSFVHDIDAPERTDSGRRMAAAIVNFTRTLGIEAIAEGIETEAQARALLAAGCAAGLGSHFFPALAFDEVLAEARPAEHT